MADIRIKDLTTTAAASSADDYIAVDGTSNGTRKLSAATPSFATSVTVPDVVGPTSTDLTLTGGSTGASLVLGATTSGAATLTSGGTNLFQKTAGQQTRFANSANSGASGEINDLLLAFYSTATAGLADGARLRAVKTDDWLTLAKEDSALTFQTRTDGGTGEVARLTNNLLIGTTTDAASLAGGLVVNGSGAGAAASSTTTGALRVTGGVGVSGAGYFGGSLNLNNGGVLFQMDGTTIGGNVAMWFRQASPSSSNYGLIGSASFTGLNAASGGIVALRIANGTVLEVNGGTSVVSTGSGYKVNIADTTSASSSTVGALTIGNGTAATNVAIGGGNVNAGGTLTVGGIASIGAAVSAGLGLNVSLDPGTLTYTAADAWVGARIAPSRAGTTGNAFAIAGQLRLASGTQTRGAAIMAEAPSGTFTNHTYFYANSSGSRVVPTGNYSLYAESVAGPAYIGDTTPSTGVGTGALQVAGGIYAGAASVFASTIATTGTVGVGVTPKTWASVTGLEIGNASIAGSTSEIYTLSNAYYNAGWKYKGTGIAQMYAQDSGGHSFKTAASGVADGAITFTNALTLATTGAATFAGAVSIGNTVGTAAAVASTHKVTMVIGGVTYYLLATNV